MGKGNRNNGVNEVRNSHLMPDKKLVNGEASGLKKKKKKGSKDVKLKSKKELESVGQQENGVRTMSSIKRLNKPQKKKKKLGSPIIVEAASGEYSAVAIPASLQYVSTEKQVVASISLGSFQVSNKKKRGGLLNKAKITVAECINPNQELANQRDECNQEHMEQEVSINVHDSTNQILEDDSMNYDQAQNTAPQNGIREEHVSFSSESGPCGEHLKEAENKQLPRFYSFRNKVLVIIEPERKFCFHGKIQIKVLYGTIRIYGATLNSFKTRIPVDVYSPRVCSPIAIEAVESEILDENKTSVWESLQVQCSDRKLANRLAADINNVEDGWAIIELNNLENELTNFFAAYSPFRLFPRIEDPSNHSWRDARRAEIVLQACLRFEDVDKQLTIDSRGIDDVADSICYDWYTKDTSRTVIAGGKSVGKSTTVRYLVNKLLGKSEAVVVLDLDPGQGEFTAAGCISLNIVDQPLLGPNFTHLRTPYYQLYIGSPDITRCFTHYIDGIRKLVDIMNGDPKLHNRPIVVNTMGFCKGIGWDIINLVLKLVYPTDVIQILSRRSKNNFEDILSRQVIDRQTLGWMTWTKDAINREKPTRHRLHVIYSEAETASGSAESWNLEPHQQRDVTMLAYLSEIIQSNGLSCSLLVSRTLPASISAVPPYIVPFSAISVSLAGAFIPKVLSVMNGNIVALCGVDAESTSTENSKNEENIYTGYPAVLIRPPLSTCYGFGILRGVDMGKKQLFVNTPLPLETMKHVNCLIGCINVPFTLLQLNQQGAPYAGSEFNLPTSREPRRGYFRTRYQGYT